MLCSKQSLTLALITFSMRCSKHGLTLAHIMLMHVPNMSYTSSRLNVDACPKHVLH
ncbi:hypothetical protein F383_21773 [Gossypium arboreum]|uniref:Uncharacterized protein n=1 Tax=Gossypium arboreum TaxID=29729 RepID=A0A0B0NXP3_GOSAR|nr:hypothetical protein F383_21773 [Gossypium arboreum]